MQDHITMSGTEIGRFNSDSKQEELRCLTPSAQPRAIDGQTGDERIGQLAGLTRFTFLFADNAFGIERTRGATRFTAS
jgi:hypothetical protein